ncbi:MAG: DUF4296 domain-containing protein [Bacteroidales bacterium]|nr:DUF4296 domain-containing protein [Bacteroidales bacterium]
MKKNRQIHLLYILSCCAMLLFSCNSSLSVPKPEEPLLEQQTVEDIILEFYLIDAEAKIRIYNEPVTMIRTDLNNRMTALFKQHNTNYKQFTSSYVYYMSDADVAGKIMSNVVNRLIKLQTEQQRKEKKQS